MPLLFVSVESGGASSLTISRCLLIAVLLIYVVQEVGSDEVRALRLVVQHLGMCLHEEDGSF